MLDISTNIFLEYYFFNYSSFHAQKPCQTSFCKISPKVHLIPENRADYSFTSNIHILSILYPKCMKFISIESSTSPLQISLRPYFHILSISTLNFHMNTIYPEWPMCTEQEISWVPLIQMSCTLYGIKLDSKWNNFYSFHFSRKRLHYNQNRATKWVTIFYLVNTSSKQIFHMTQLCTTITPRKFILFPWNFYSSKIIKSLTFF